MTFGFWRWICSVWQERFISVSFIPQCVLRIVLVLKIQVLI